MYTYLTNYGITDFNNEWTLLSGKRELLKYKRSLLEMGCKMNASMTASRGITSAKINNEDYCLEWACVGFKTM